MKTLIILAAPEEKLEYLPLVRLDIVLYIGKINLEDDDAAPANVMCLNGKLTREAKEHIVSQIQKGYGADVLVLFLELKGKQMVCPDDYTLEIKSE